MVQLADHGVPVRDSVSFVVPGLGLYYDCGEGEGLGGVKGPGPGLDVDLYMPGILSFART